MKRILLTGTVILGLFGLVACGKPEQVEIEPETVAVEETASVETAEVANDKTESGNTVSDKTEATAETDAFGDRSEEIKKAVKETVSGAASLNDEFAAIEKLSAKYGEEAKKAESQTEMNATSAWFYNIWDSELNELWSRISDSADAATKEKLLNEQRNWISMKEAAVYENIGSMEENGSWYPMLVNAFYEKITRNRAYVLGNELAKIKGESFSMPAYSSPYGYFVDNQGTGDVYSSIVLREGMEAGSTEARISIYRLTVLDGTFEDGGNGEVVFTSNDGAVTGTIKNNGWDGATFKVTESTWSLLPAGEEFTFPLAI
ncbi:MAG: DUF1311 domain-containing protein [Pseudobutyrivibrio sp.]|nr:DUF1311 domain-containing protein [Pseudobutyrivibrio sp.]